jgi:SAM-dependent methyltransferase
MNYPLLDCRPFADFCTAHCRNSCSIPTAELPVRMHELPKNTEPLAVCGDASSLPQAVAFLTSKGYRVVEQIHWTPEYAARLQAEGKLESGAHSQRLWQPAPLLTRFVTEFMPEYAIAPGKGLDIGCGAGRDMVFLAMHGWQMTGVDYIPGALQRAQQLAASQQVSVTTWLRDLETGQDPFADLAEASFDLLCVARYLHRPLFPWLKRLLKPGGIIIYQTFMQGAEQFGSPRNPNFLLKPGELAAIFSSVEILLDAVEYLDDGRPVSAFIARCL